MADIELPDNAQAIDPDSLTRHFGGREDLLSLWIAEPYLPLATPITEALARRAAHGWFGYETRPAALEDAFRAWHASRHGWAIGDDTHLLVSPAVGTSIGALIELTTGPGDGVVLQPPVFTDFKPLVTRNQRVVARNPLHFEDGTYRFDLDGLEQVTADESVRALVLCSPHNPVGRVWSAEELVALATICAANDVFVIADEIHADLVMAPHRFTPFASAAAGTGVRWAALHGPIKTFGLAGVTDTLIITDDAEIAERFSDLSSRLHLTRNNVFGMAAAQAGYRHGGAWLDETLTLIAANAQLLRDHLPAPLRLVALEGTYLAWLDCKGLGLDVPELAAWLSADAGLALSPGHWFGREGAGFARMTVAAPTEMIGQAIERLTDAVSRR